LFISTITAARKVITPLVTMPHKAHGTPRHKTQAIHAKLNEMLHAESSRVID
jgi:hypothetical protein